MTFPNLWGTPEWLWPSGLLLLVAIGLLIWSYSRSEGPTWIRIVSPLLKAVGLTLLVMILLEPKVSRETPRPGANLFVMLADKSESLTINDPGLGSTREEQLLKLIDPESAWNQIINDQYDLRRYTFDSSLHPVNDFASYVADGRGSQLVNALKTVSRRVQGRPCGGLLLFTDGNATDFEDNSIDWELLPPVYPVVLGTDKTDRDLKISRLSVSQTNFEAAPVMVSTELESTGYAGKTVIAQLLDDSGNELQRKTIKDILDNKKFAVRFEVKPEGRGIHFYQVLAFEQSQEAGIEKGESTNDASLANNSRRIAIDRGKGPYRILYVCGRPNWEFKFLNRALYKDDEVNLVGLIRVANKEPKFSFRGHIEESTNPLFRGFGNQEDQTAEQYDEPVVIRIGTEDKKELAGGFPKEAEDLFAYDAIIIDDLEASFFTQDQKSLIQQFVSIRGGTMLMLGGQESFANGGYHRTPIGEMLPVYLDNFNPGPANEQFRLQLTREGWLQPWVRVRSTEEAERVRLGEMTEFKTVNRVRSIKPGATVLSQVATQNGDRYPALVVQKFGNGNAAAMLIGDLWRWQMKGSKDNDDLMKSWRQTARWLVSDVPQRISLDVKRRQDSDTNVEIRVHIRDIDYKSLDNASVSLAVKTPEMLAYERKNPTKKQDDQAIRLNAQPSDSEAGVYVATFVCRTAGDYLAKATVTAPDGTLIGNQETGWVHEPSTEEFRNLKPDRQFLMRIAEKTGGEVIDAQDLESFVKTIPNTDTMVTETEIRPWWHQWFLLVIVIGLFVTEWGLRRWKGLP